MSSLRWNLRKHMYKSSLPVPLWSARKRHTWANPYLSLVHFLNRDLPPHCILCNVHCTPHSVHRLVYSVYRIVYRRHCILYRCLQIVIFFESPFSDATNSNATKFSLTHSILQPTTASITRLRQQDTGTVHGYRKRHARRNWRLQATGRYTWSCR